MWVVWKEAQSEHASIQMKQRSIYIAGTVAIFFINIS
jgi:hypothetical protein